MRKLPWRNIFFILTIGLAAAINVKYCLNAPENTLAYSNSILSFLLWAGWSFALWKTVNAKDWEKVSDILNSCFVFALCFTGSLVAGVQLDRQGAVNFGDWRIYVATLCVSVAAAPLLGGMIRKLEAYNLRDKEYSPKRERDGANRKKYFFIVWGVLFLSYVPLFLATYPGLFVYDAQTEVNMVFTEVYSAHHPAFHVLLLGGVIRVLYKLTGSYNAGIATYLILQMIFLSGCFAYTMSFLRRVGVRRWIRFAGVLFLALFPAVGMFVCCSAKDGIFSGGVLLFCTSLLDMARDCEKFWKQKDRRLCFVFSMLLILLFRNNGIYALAVFMILFAILYKKWWRKWIIPVIASFVISVAAAETLEVTFHFEKGEVAEMLCVPIQQLARVHAEKKESFTEEELDALYRLIPEKYLDHYRPKLADDVKVGFDEKSFRESFKRYLSLWAKKGREYPDVYMNSFLVNTYGFWYPDTILDAYRGRKIGEMVYQDSSFFEFAVERPGISAHLIPGLERFYEKISLEIFQQKLPVVSMFFSIGFWYWCYMFLCFYLLLTGHGKQAGAFAIMGLLYLTVLLGPVAIVRYVLYFYFGVPLVLALLFDTKTVAGKEERVSSEGREVAGAYEC